MENSNIPVCYLFASVQIQILHIAAQLGECLHRPIGDGLAAAQTQLAQKPSTSSGDILYNRTLQEWYK